MESNVKKASPAIFILILNCLFLAFVTFSCGGQKVLSLTDPVSPNSDWQLAYNNGSTSMIYTSGSLQLRASRSAPDPAGSLIGLVSKQTFSGNVDVTFDLNHQGYGKTEVGLFATFELRPLVFVDLDTDDVACLWMNAPGLASAISRCPSSQYMNRWLTLRIKVEGNQVSFLADETLLATVPETSPAGSYRVGFAVSSVSWKSGDNFTSIRRVTVGE